MIRTRDLFVFVVLLLTIGIGIALTVFFRDVSHFQNVAQVLLKNNTADQASFSADAPSVTENRSATIERLRSLIASGASYIQPSPSVEDTATSTTKSKPVASSTNMHPSVLLSCGGDDSLGVDAQWPTDIDFQIEKNSRRLTHTVKLPNTTKASTTVATSSVLKTETVTLLSLVAFPNKQSKSVCVPSPIIGVTVGGKLLVNSSRQYAGFSADSQIGYARDGFPIYGIYEGPVDACGGYEHPKGYRYSLSSKRDTILNCYFAPPAKFIMQ